ncbi:MAG: hypothetical protein Q9167_003675 [Letrouitia subvulpina]
MSSCPPFPIYSPSPFLDTNWEPEYLRKRYKRLQRLCVNRISNAVDEDKSTKDPTSYQHDEPAGYASQEQQTGLRNKGPVFHPTADRAIHAKSLSQLSLRGDRTLSAIEEESASESPSHASSETDSQSFECRFERLSRAIEKRLQISFTTPAENGTVTISTQRDSAVKAREPRPDLYSPETVSKWSLLSSENNKTTTGNESMEISAPRLAWNRQQRFVTPSPRRTPSWRWNSSSDWSTTSDGTSSTSEDQMERALLPVIGPKLYRSQVENTSPVSPIQLDYDREINDRTPSVHSNGSKPDLESPSYANSRRAIAKEVHPAFREHAEQEQLHRPLRIFRDEGQEEDTIRLPQQRDDGVLGNVTNTRQIGGNDGHARVAGTGGQNREERHGAVQDRATRLEGRTETRSVWRQVLPSRWRNRLSGLR